MNENVDPIPWYRRRKFRWTLAAFCVAGILFAGWRISLHMQINTLIQELHEAGYLVTLEDLEAAYPPVPDDENAAAVILEAVDRMKWPTEEEREQKFPWTNSEKRFGETDRLNTESLAFMRQIVADNQQVLRDLHRAAEMKKSRYPIDLSAIFIADEPHWDKISQAEILLMVESEVCMADNDVEGACEAIQSIVGLARSLDNEPVMMSYVIRQTALLRAAKQCERLMNLTSAEPVTIKPLAKSFEAAEAATHFDRVMGGELATMGVKYQRPIGQWSDEEGQKSGSDWYTSVAFVTGFMDQSYLLVLKRMKTNLEISRFPMECRIQALSAANLKETDHSPANILASFDFLMMETYPRDAYLDLRAIALLRMARTAITIKRFAEAEGQQPNELTDAAPKFIDTVPDDPFAGTPLHYVKRDRGFVLYSVGDDMTDNGGNRFDAQGRVSREPGTDIVFEVTR